jgi:hypothetical protein
MKSYTSKEGLHAIFGRRSSAEHNGKAGRYLIEKLREGEWILMSYGDADFDARPGAELDKLIQRAEVLEGTCRIRRKRDDVIVWPPEQANPPATAAVNEQRETEQCT